MERSIGRPDHPVPGSGAGRPLAIPGRLDAAGREKRLDAMLVLLLAGEIAAFAALTASGNMPAIVTVLYRALLTL